MMSKCNNKLFIYRELKPKANISFSRDNSTVNYTSPSTYVFVPEMSVADPKDYNITTINVPLVVSTSGSTTYTILLYSKHINLYTVDVSNIAVSENLGLLKMFHLGDVCANMKMQKTFICAISKRL